MIRAWLLTFAVAFGSAALASYAGVTQPMRGGLSGSLVTAILAGIAAAAPAPYAARAGLAAIAGLVPLALGAQGQGPLAAIGANGARQAAASLVLVTVLPAALFFRAQYRAFSVARAFLALALVASVPGVYLLVESVADPASGLAGQVTSAIAVAASLTAFAGFLGAETTGACTAWAFLILLTQGARFCAHAFEAGSEAGALGSFATCAVGEVVAGAVLASGAYQLLAALFARQARKVDIHQIVGPSAEPSVAEAGDRDEEDREDGQEQRG